MSKELKTFRPGQAVFYKPKDSSGKVYKVEAGIVKRMSDDGTRAFVWYHSGCTAASTPVEYLEATDLTNDHSVVHKGCSQCGYPDKI